MRALCGVPAPPSCGPRPGAPLPAAARFLSLRLPAAPGSSAPSAAPLCLLVDAKARFRDLRAHALGHLRYHSVRDADIFGIAVLSDGDYLFPDRESKLSKYAPKSWRSSHTHGLDANGRPLLELHLRVQFYVECASLVRDAGARRHYVRQLRAEAAARAASLPSATRARLDALARRADSPSDPADAAEAELRYLREACAVDRLNAHCYRLRATKRDPEPGSVRLYVRAAGLTVAPDSRPPASFPWPTIGKLSFDRKKFEIRAGESRITLYSSADEKSKLLLALCRDAHQFSMRTPPKPPEGPARDADDEAPPPFGDAPRGDRGDQRISVVSSASASSNTTSGIVSDRVHSEDELEIMIDSPPAAAPPAPRLTAEAVARGRPGAPAPAPSETSGVYTMTASTAVPASEDGSLDCGSFGPRARSAGSASSAGRLAPADLAPSECASFCGGGSSVSGDADDDGDGVDGAEPPGAFRARADSGASAAESFRGDGSDPTDRLHGPLSAEELSDLIVGRAEYPPAAPAAPGSECDYATLPQPVGRSYLPGHEDTAPSEDGYPEGGDSPSPPPPVPPKRTDSAAVRPEPAPDADPAGSLRELRLGIPVGDPPPYPGRACAARFLPSGPHVAVLRAHASALGPVAEPSWAAPPPPPPLMACAGRPAAVSQIELCGRRLRSDVECVVCPLRDCLDAKLAAVRRGGGSALALSDAYARLPPCAIAPRREPPPPPFGGLLVDGPASAPPYPRRLPPPPPPYPRRPPPREPPARPPADPAEPIDIKTLREKSKNLDLPLIAALCNDRSLLKQTKAFVMPKHGDRERGERGRTRRPVSGSGAGVGPARRGCHRHPGDALPALPRPTPRATPNAYVTDPRPPAVA